MEPKCLITDRISSLPNHLIETILCLIPIKDAVRTSILSKKWRYSWNKIPKLVFIEKDMFDVSTDKDHKEDEDEEEDEEEEEEDSYSETEEDSEFEEEEDSDMEEDEEDERKEMMRMMKKENAERKELIRKCKHFEDLHRKSKIINAIHQVMLMHHGAISEFTLSMNLDNKCDEIDKIITYLSWKNTVKKLTLQMNVDLGDEIAPYKLPSSVFTFRLLTDLYLQQCSLYHLPRVGGFSCLTSLFLKDVGTNAAMVLRIVSKCPLLRSFGLVKFHWNVTFTLSFLCKLFGCLPVIEHLNIPIMPYWLSKSKFDLPKHPTPMVHLKYAHLHGSCFIGEYGLSFAVNFIRSSINLEKLKLQGYHNFKEEISEIDSFIPEENPDIRLEHLKELEFNVYRIIPELKFMKLILAISPVLKKVKITFQHIVNKHEEVDMLNDLSDAPRASEMAEIVVEHLLSDDES